MRNKTIIAVVASLSAAAPACASFILVDDFESYTVGTEVSAAAGSNWFQENSNVLDNVVTDPAVLAPDSLTNQVLSYANVTGTDNVLWNTEFSIAEGDTGTVFFRARLDNVSSNSNFGLTDTGTPSGFGDYHPQARFGQDSSDLSVRDGGSFRNVADIDEDVWYNIWLVVDNGADESLLYIQSDEDSDFATQTQLSMGDPIDFRSDTTGTLSKFLLSSGDNDVVYYDDIFFDADGANLANPIPEPASAGAIGLGCLSLLTRRRR